MANSAFTGIGSEFDPGTQLLSGSPALAAGQGCTIDFRVRLTYASVAVIPTASQSNRVAARTSTSTGGAHRRDRRKRGQRAAADPARRRHQDGDGRESSSAPNRSSTSATPSCCGTPAKRPRRTCR